MKANYQTSISFSEEDFYKKEKLRKSKVSIIDTWRRGADEILDEILKKRVRK